MPHSAPLLLLFLLGLCSRAPAQTINPRTATDDELTGIWTGQLVQNEHPLNVATDFALSMNLRQAGPFVRGTAYVSFADHYVELKLSGYRLENGAYELTETEILRSTMLKNAEWCYKGYRLQLSYGSEGLILSGPWWGKTGSGFACIPGAVTLYRRKGRV